MILIVSHYMKITILMPSLNEEKSIGTTIDRIPLDKLKEKGFETEILIIDGKVLIVLAKLLLQKARE